MAPFVPTKKTRVIYLTAQDRKARTSKTITIRGDRLTPTLLINTVIKALNKRGRKAG